ncbi:uncharacterized protein LOC143266151 [Megachile rotundata]|uniref:uncharacterized protein LOC143266151 n=1 Tax=Megachile rotundata TaxID=143995 RepID=UPI003FCFCDA7
MITFKGSVLPTRLLIGQGHVGIKIEPYVEPVRQCFKCLKYGHYQAQCKEEVRKYVICGENNHGQCDRKPRCVNCGGVHGSLARMCWIWQREAAIKKVMAYKNVEFETAGGMVARSTGDIERDRTGGLDDFVGSNGDFPALAVKERRETWEKKEVPIQREVELIRRLRQERNGERGVRQIQGEGNRANFSEVTKRRSPERREEKRDEEDWGQGAVGGMEEKDKRKKEEEGWKQVRGGVKPSCYREDVDGVVLGNRYLCLECKEKTVKQKREGRIQLLERIPLPRYMVGETPEGECEYEKLELALNKNEMERERRRIRREKQINREWLVELEKRKEEDILEDVIKMLKEKHLEGKLEEIMRAGKYRAKRTVLRDPEEDWNAVTTPTFEMTVDEKTRKRLQRKGEREREELKIRREREEKERSLSIIDWNKVRESGRKAEEDRRRQERESGEETVEITQNTKDKEGEEMEEGEMRSEEEQQRKHVVEKEEEEERER